MAGVKAGAIGVLIAIGWIAISISGAPARNPVVTARKPEPPQAGSPVEIQMRNVAFRVARDIVLEVRSLRGRLRPTHADRPVTFDDSDSFIVEIDSGEVAMTSASLTALLNSYVLAGGGPIRNVSVTIEGSKLIQKGTLHKGVSLPFEVEGSVSATPSGDIRVHAEKIKSAHLPVKGLLHLFGASLSKLVNGNAGRGLRVDGDDMILLPRYATPPPHLEGRVTQVSLTGGRIVQVFDSGKRPQPLNPPFVSEGYIYHKGGMLRFGKLTMDDADLEIVGDRTTGYFDFFMREYKRQLVAGYSKNTEANGLVTHMVDYSRLPASSRQRAK
jgi:hypothetical protein